MADLLYFGDLWSSQRNIWDAFATLLGYVRWDIFSFIVLTNMSFSFHLSTIKLPKINKLSNKLNFPEFSLSRFCMNVDVSI
jgi:hypothetical protein